MDEFVWAQGQYSFASIHTDRHRRRQNSKRHALLDTDVHESILRINKSAVEHDMNDHGLLFENALFFNEAGRLLLD